MYAAFFPFPPAITVICKILRKRRNSAETGKFRGLAQNSAYRGKLWSHTINLRKQRDHTFNTGTATVHGTVAYPAEKIVFFSDFRLLNFPQKNPHKQTDLEH